MNSEKKPEQSLAARLSNRRSWLLLFYDFLIFLLVEVALLIHSPSSESKPGPGVVFPHMLVFFVCLLAARFTLDVYHHVVRYGGSSSYIRLIAADVIAGGCYYLLQLLLPIPSITFIRVVSIVMFNLLGALTIRLLYLFLYDYANQHPNRRGCLWHLIALLTANAITPADRSERAAVEANKINIAIVGAGRVGALLAEELLKNPGGAYRPRCFIDNADAKIGRIIDGVPVISDEEATVERLNSFGVSEIVFALPQMEPEQKKALYEQYKAKGFKLKVYDYPQMKSTDGGRRRMREFSIEELLFRQPIVIRNEMVSSYYSGKTVMITGGGGSIGSELCRQIARMSPKQLIIVDVYENGAYDVQQELRLAYGNALSLAVEILSVCDTTALDRTIAAYKPDVLLHAAAHKHVPLMEHNVCEAIKNNVFGTYNTASAAVRHGIGKFVLISTDKAVNPTNVMGATKRMCEMIVQGHRSMQTETQFAIVRFGNVLGSAGSVIPLFRRQIESGGPVTITDRRIIRYFMTIPEASQLVLEAGAMARGSELFVLDMGKPVRILELAENMIRLSGLEPYSDIDIVETGLRPGEKLYEELLVQPDQLEKTENSLIFVEREEQISHALLKEKLQSLSAAVSDGDDDAAREALHRVVPTFLRADEVNRHAVEAREMQMVQGEAN
ncbi:MAG: polysaccharide biosynthesis protein [Clostridia bacterium]|nr:polysaccharide biosynthesis protein [Clostridia bacterium]